MKIAAIVFVAPLALVAGCPGSSNPDGGAQSTSGRGSSGGSSGASNAALCPLGAGCTLANGGGGVCCASGCVNPSSDPQNCGACGYVCPGGASCLGGYCTIDSCAGASPDLGCALLDSGPGECCAGACVDFNSAFNRDPQNCGGCGDACETGSQCVEGSCLLADGGPGDCNVDADCPAGDSCNYNGCQPSSCAAAGAGTACALGAGFSNPTGLCCAGSCLDFRWDDENCGGCGFLCPSGQACLNGGCAPHVSCGPSTVGATCLVSSGHPGTCCGATCVDTSSEAADCGGCGQACPTGSRCVAGTCTRSDGGSASCSPPAVGCPVGTLCAAGGCIPAGCAGTSGFCFLGIESPGRPLLRRCLRRSRPGREQLRGVRRRLRLGALRGGRLRAGRDDLRRRGRLPGRRALRRRTMSADRLYELHDQPLRRGRRRARRVLSRPVLRHVPLRRSGHRSRQLRRLLPGLSLRADLRPGDLQRDRRPLRRGPRLRRLRPGRGPPRSLLPGRRVQQSRDGPGQLRRLRPALPERSALRGGELPVAARRVRAAFLDRPQRASHTPGRF